MSIKNTLPDSFLLDDDQTEDLGDKSIFSADSTIPIRLEEVCEEPGERAKFQKKEVLGEGGMGVVHSAYDSILHRHVALKSLLKKSSPSSSYWKRFLREAQITAQLQHPSIVPIHSVEFDEDGQPILIMKQIDGQTLETFLRECSSCKGTSKYRVDRHGLFSRLELLLRVCEAIHYAHCRGVLHRDLKPENIMVGQFEEVYVMDWGIARTTEDDVDEEYGAVDVEDLGVRTLDGSIIGTPMYMAPEQALGRQAEVSFAADLYSLGMILFELVTLQPARTSASVQELLDEATMGVQPTIQTYDGNMDPRMRSIILKATHPEIQDRYASVKELALDVRRFVRNESVLAHPDGLMMRTWRYFSRNPVVSVSIFSTIVLVSLFVALLSLYSALRNQEAVTQRQNTTSHLISTVSEQVRNVDEVFAEIQMLLNGLTMAATFQMRNLERDLDSCVLFPDLIERTGIRKHPRYNNRLISLREPVCVLAPGVTKEDAALALSLTPVLADELIAIFQQDQSFTDYEDSFWRDVEQHHFQWSYVALEDGTLINYPGIDHFADGYDPRLRPWYVSGKKHVQPQCDEPYPDASGSGYLLPCNQRMVDNEGKVVGVAGIDLSMDVAIDIIQRLPAPMLNYSFVLNDDGKVLLDSREKGVKLDPEQALKGNTRKKLNRFNNAELLDRLTIDKTNGLLAVNDEVFVYSRMQFVPWTLVYSFAPEILTCVDCF